jgi:hypothetical protein
MASSAGRQFKGRATLRARIADGNDPATHSLSFWFHPQDQAYTSAGANASELRAMLDTIVPIASLVATSRASIVRSWGDPSDTDVVWLALASEVSDVAAFNAALDKWLASTGGNDSPTHVGPRGYASLAEMEQYRDGLAGDPDYQAFQLALGKASRRMGATLSHDVKSWGPAKLQSFKP